MKPARIYWIAGSLLLAGAFMLIAALFATGPSTPVALAGDKDHHPPKHTKTPKATATLRFTKTPKPSATPKHTKTPKPSPTPKHTATPEHSPTPEDTPTLTPSPSPSPTPDPSPTRTPSPTREPDPTRTPDPPTATPDPPTSTPTPFQETGGITQVPNAGDGGLLAQHREGVAVLGFLLVILAVGMIAARGAVDAKRP